MNGASCGTAEAAGAAEPETGAGGAAGNADALVWAWIWACAAGSTPGKTARKTASPGMASLATGREEGAAGRDDTARQMFRRLMA